EHSSGNLRKKASMEIDLDIESADYHYGLWRSQGSHQAPIVNFDRTLPRWEIHEHVSALRIGRGGRPHTSIDTSVDSHGHNRGVGVCVQDPPADGPGHGRRPPLKKANQRKAYQGIFHSCSHTIGDLCCVEN